MRLRASTARNDSAPSARVRHAPVLWRTALIAAAAWFAYLPALHGTWLWDDRADVLSNALLRDLSGLWRIWFEPGALPDYYPIKATVQWLQWQLWGERTTGYHVTNVTLHIVSALLFWRVLFKLGVRHGWLGALLFTVHPINVESVAWIAELKNTLSLPPLLWSASRFLDFLRTERRADYAWSVALFLVAMLCKTSVVMFPVWLLLAMWWWRRRMGWPELRCTAPFFAISLALGLVTMWLQNSHAIGDEPIPLGGALDRVALGATTLAFYFIKCVWPASLMPLYPHRPVDVGVGLATLMAIVAAFALLWFWSRRARAAGVVLLGLGWFVLHLLPFIGFVPISYFRFTWAMDHFAYVPLLGVMGVAAAGLDQMLEQATRPARQAAAAAVIATCGGLAWMSHVYSMAYRDPIALWSYALQRNPDAWPAHNNLGQAYLATGEHERAIQHLETALALKPGLVDAHNNLGNALLSRGRAADAIVHFRAVLEQKPDYAAAHNNLAIALRRMGQLPLAVTHLEAALRLQPEYAEASNNLANTLLALNRPTEAVEHYRRAVTLQPGFAEAHFNLAVTLLELGRTDEARHHYEIARRLAPSMPALRF